MDLYGLDKDGGIVTMLCSNNIQWNRKYYEPGDFSVRIATADFFPAIHYIYRSDRTELGIVQKVGYVEEKTKEYVQLSGFFAEDSLRDKIVYPTFYASGNIENEVKQMVDAYKEDLPLTVSQALGLGAKIDFQETGGELGPVAAKRLQTQELGQRIRYDFTNNLQIYEIFQGRDLTQSQTKNNPVTFSTMWENLWKPKVMEDSTQEKNYAVIAGEGKDKERIIEELDLSRGGYRRKIFLNASSVRYDPEKQTMQEYRESLRQYGLEKMLKYRKVQNVDFIVPHDSGYEYMVDFDLGDKCTVIVEQLQIALETRIISVKEVLKDGQEIISLVFGDKILKDYEKERVL